MLSCLWREVAMSCLMWAPPQGTAGVRVRVPPSTPLLSTPAVFSLLLVPPCRPLHSTPARKSFVMIDIQRVMLLVDTGVRPHSPSEVTWWQKQIIAVTWEEEAGYHSGSQETESLDWKQGRAITPKASPSVTHLLHLLKMLYPPHTASPAGNFCHTQASGVHFTSTS